jgi:hypothetical protein
VHQEFFAVLHVPLISARRELELEIDPDAYSEMMVAINTSLSL